MSTLYAEPSVIIKRGEQTGSDRYGKPIYGPPTEVEAPCWYKYNSGDEDVARGQQYTIGYFIQWPSRFYAQVRGCDEVRLSIGTFTIKGRPGFQADGLAISGYVQATLEEVTG